MNKIRTIIGGIDTPDPRTWTDQLRVLLEMGAFPHGRCVANRVVLQCLFAPSFDAESWIEIEETGEGANVTLRTQQTNLWYWQCYRLMRANGKCQPDEAVPAEPRLWTEAATATPEQFESFWGRIPSEVPKKAEQKWATADGMQVNCDYHRRNGQFDSFSSNGVDDPATIELADAACWLAEQAMLSPESRKALNSIRRYFA